MYMYQYQYQSQYLCVYIYMYVYIYIYIYMYVCVYVYIYMLHACIHAYIIRAYIHTYTSVWKGIMYTRGPRSPNHIFLQRPRQADAAQRNPGSPYNKQSSRHKVLQNSASTKPFKVLNHVTMLIPWTVNVTGVLIKVLHVEAFVWCVSRLGFTVYSSLNHTKYSGL